VNAVQVIVWKEWLEMRQQRLLLIGLIMPPLIFTAVALGATAAARSTDRAGAVARGNPQFAGLSPVELSQALPASQLSLLYLFLPVILTSIITSYSIVGEKNSGTLEPVLATPVRTWEFLLGKCLAAFLVAVGVSWLGGAVFIWGVARLAISPRVFAAVVNPGWLIVLLVWTPLLALLANALTMAISSRVNDARAAQQISAVIVAPFLGIFFAQLAGARLLSVGFTLTVAGALLVLVVGGMALVTRIFQREAILTRWK